MSSRQNISRGHAASAVTKRSLRNCTDAHLLHRSIAKHYAFVTHIALLSPHHEKKIINYPLIWFVIQFCRTKLTHEAIWGLEKMGALHSKWRHSFSYANSRRKRKNVPLFISFGHMKLEFYIYKVINENSDAIINYRVIEIWIIYALDRLDEVR